MKKTIYIFSALVSLFLIIGSIAGFLPISLAEVLGFITGGLCVWLTVKENIWNWPIGIVNSVFFAILFWQSKLFADMSLQFIYIVLGFLGWYWWLHGGKNKKELEISNTNTVTWIGLTIFTVIATYFIMLYLRSVADSAPLLDALTTVLSLDAQYLLTKKIIENWWFWIIADVLYIGMYAYKNLYLTAILYLIFFCMCIRGFIEWRTTQKKKADRVIAQK